ncbi:MAG: hypothetical protein ACXVCO_13685, partial [Ktedonobacterales bacterium]
MAYAVLAWLIPYLLINQPYYYRGSNIVHLPMGCKAGFAVFASISFLSSGIAGFLVFDSYEAGGD